MSIQIDKTSHVSAYMQVKDRLKDYISQDKLKAGDPLPKLRDICEWADVSLRTAQKAVNELAKSGDCRRVGKRMIITTPSSKNQHEVFAICDHIGRSTFKRDHIQEQIMSGVRTVATGRRNCEIVFLNTPPENSIKFFHQQFGSLLKGVILLHWQDADELHKLADKFPDIKFVQVNYQLSDFGNFPSNVYGVFNDDYSGGYQVADYFVANDAKNPVFLELQINNPTYQIRRKGFINRFSENGIKGKVIEIPDCSNLSHNAQLREFYKQFADFFEKEPETDAVLCSNDVIAQCVGYYLDKHELFDKVKLFGYDDYVGMGHSRFSSVSVNYKNMGQRALQLLINTENKPKVQNLTPQLMIRQNCNIQLV